MPIASLVATVRRSPNRRSSLTSAALTTCALLVCAHAAGAQPTYAVRDLGVLPGTVSCTPMGLNDLGDVVGYCDPAVSDWNQEGFVWHNGVMTSTGKLPKGNYTMATAINNRGGVAGDGDTGNVRPQGWVLTAAGPSNFFSNNGGNTHVVAFSDLNVIGGYYTKSLSGNTASWRGATWTWDAKRGKYQMFTLPILPGTDAATASAISLAFNQSGQAAGYAVNDQIGQHAAFWNGNAAHAIVDLGTFPGDWSSVGYAINDLGEVVGASHPAFGSRPVVWANDAAHTPHELIVLPGDNQGTAYAINRQGHVLGSSYSSTPGTWNSTPARLVIWRDGGVWELNALVEAGVTVSTASAINNRGQIAASVFANGRSFAALLTPPQ